MRYSLLARIKSMYFKFLAYSWKFRPDITCGKVVLNGVPVVDLRNGGRLLIGNDVRLNSCNKGYHLNMYGPVKLFADRPEAVIEIGDKTRIHGSCLHAYSSIKIGSKCLIAANCNIIDCSGHDLSFDDVDNRINTNGGARPIIIEDSVWICANVTVLPGVTIGRGTVVSTGSVVSNSLPPMVLAAGNPARPILTYTKDK